MLRWAEFRDLQRRAAAHQEPWEARGKVVYSETQQLVGEFHTAEAAQHIALIHNNFGAVCNLTLVITKLLKDAQSNAKVSLQTLKG